MTSRISSATVAVVGGAHGIGVLVNKQTGDRKYLNFKRTELGAGLGLTKFRFLVLAEDAEALENISSKKYLSGLAADISVGEKGSSGGYNSAGYRVYTISESGASIAATARLTKVSVNTDLTDTGISEVSIPNIGFGIGDGREPVEQRTWAALRIKSPVFRHRTGSDPGRPSSGFQRRRERTFRMGRLRKRHFLQRNLAGDWRRMGVALPERVCFHR
jgi:hypothetical protein